MTTKQLFNKVACFTDIHFGLKQDSRQHNIDCENFIYWFLDEADKFGADTCIFLGDWHHNRARINVSTMNYSISNIERLGKAFDQFFFIPGNHDLYYRDKREINSMEFGRFIDNVSIISEPTTFDNVSLLPWLVGNEWKKIKNLKSKYIFGHFELPKFKMNQMIEMPETGELSAADFTNIDYVFSGHFHKRQQKENIVYIGNAFPHNYADVEDDDRGLMLLEWDKEPIFKNWADAPKYRRLLLSKLLENPELLLDNKTYARIEIDISINYEDLNYIRDELINILGPRDLSMLPIHDMNEISTDYDGEISFESVDSVVLSHLQSIDSPNIKSQLLVAIYRSLSI